MTDAAPLADRLHLVRGMRLWVGDLPEELRSRIDHDTSGLSVEACASAGLDAACFEVADNAEAEHELRNVAPLLSPAGFVWLLWRSDADFTAAAIAGSDDQWLTVVEPTEIAAGWQGIKLKPRPRQPAD
jgi:hypothetical protein